VPGTLVDEGAVVTLQVRSEEQQPGVPGVPGVPGWVIPAVVALLVAVGAAVLLSAVGAAASQHPQRRPSGPPHIDVRLDLGPPHVHKEEAREW
jgi:hypothetical protein